MNTDAGYGVPPVSVGGTNGNRDIAQQKTVEFPQVRKSWGGLPGRYLYVITHPAAKTFEDEGSRARWSWVFAQVVGYAIIMVVLGLITSRVISAVLGDVARIIDGFPGLSAFT